MIFLLLLLLMTRIAPEAVTHAYSILESPTKVNGRGGGEKVLSDITLIRSKHMKGSKECYLLEQKHTLQIFGVVPIIKLQNNTLTRVKW